MNPTEDAILTLPQKREMCEIDKYMTVFVKICYCHVSMPIIREKNPSTCSFGVQL